ncbi:Lrp/AsnC family transcriptional regulator [Parahaliea mediterranea]|uniref:Lrp/AsnC family transcriptional regulator n=1 Tax=Parahaliea mediterranea TaxID=651086 RepID=A0A939IP62_9GAMM|nr:Lrp/AsnC family transcriptional regulator [Parahaliea mediterranea]MBN7798737.1 Lrp/AsnC family transcriptional regulator [Parahaliea mediterranea]
MDPVDRALLRAMQRDASLSIAALADTVNISKSACWRRVQRLEEAGVIRSRVTLLNPERVGLSLTVFISIRTNQHNARWARQFNRVMEGIPGVLEVYRTGGELDYLIKAVVRDMPDYDRLYHQLIEADLFDVSASFVMEQIKHTTELPLD